MSIIAGISLITAMSAITNVLVTVREIPITVRIIVAEAIVRIMVIGTRVAVGRISEIVNRQQTIR